MCKVNNRNTRTRCAICSKLTIKTPERNSFRIENPSQTSKMKLSANIVEGFKPFTIFAKISILDVWILIAPQLRSHRHTLAKN